MGVRDILGRRNVVGFSRRLQPRIRGGRVVSGETVFRVYVSRKVPEDQLDREDLIPRSVRIGFRRYRTDVVEIGEVRALSLTDRVRPLKTGYSIGHKDVTAGTLGAFLFGGDDSIYILSNNHVLANQSSDKMARAWIGDAILQPGSYDGGRYSVLDSGDAVASLHTYIPLKIGGVNYVDAAVATLLSTELFEETPFTGYLGNESIVEGMELEYCGRSSGCRKVRVIDSSAYVKVMFDIGVLEFDDQVIISPNPIPGDSGSVLYDPESMKTAALLFAGSERIGVANKMWRVIESFRNTGLELRFEPPERYRRPPAELLDAYIASPENTDRELTEIAPGRHVEVAKMMCFRSFTGYIVFNHVKLDGAPYSATIHSVSCIQGPLTISLTLDTSSFEKGEYIMRTALLSIDMGKVYGKAEHRYRVI